MYQQGCKVMNIRPLPEVIKILQVRSDTLDFQKTYLGDKQVKALSAALKLIQPLSLNLSYQGIRKEGITELLSALSGGKIQVLDISHNDFPTSTTQQLIDFIKKTPNLKQLNILQCTFLHAQQIYEIKMAMDKL